MLIKHTAPASVVDEMALDAVLAESGLTENNQDRSLEARAYLNASGAALADLCGNLAAISQDADKDSTRLKAITQALAIQGAVAAKDSAPQAPQIALIIQGADEVKVQQVLNPYNERGIHAR